MKNNLPAGLLDHNYEFFVSDDLHAYCLTHGQVIDFDDMKDGILTSIEYQMSLHPLKIAAYKQMHMSKYGCLPSRKELLKQFIICNYGGFDAAPDMVDGILQPTEYWPCPNRGSCPFEGIGCDGLRTNTGEFLTRREIEIVKLIAAGYLDKQIADHLDLAVHTVTTHTRNVRNKTGLLRKADITRFAHQNQLA